MDSNQISELITELKNINNNLHVANTLLVENNLIVNYVANDEWSKEMFRHTITNQLSNHMFHKKENLDESHIKEMEKELKNLGVLKSEN
jgi:hypothetical protein